MSYVNTALDQSAFRIHKYYIINYNIACVNYGRSLAESCVELYVKFSVALLLSNFIVLCYIIKEI